MVLVTLPVDLTFDTAEMIYEAKQGHAYIREEIIRCCWF